jgi:hypothetical protein
MITDASIKSAIARATAGAKVELRDAGDRGAGRLVLLIRMGEAKAITEWYAVWYRAGKRSMAKIGSYPAMPLADARKRFREDYAPIISAGDIPVANRARAKARGTTLKDMFEAYRDHLKAKGSASWVTVERLLLTGKYAAVNDIGPTMPAARVRPDDITPYLAKTHGRGSAGAAYNARAFISAAFAFAMKSEHDYRKGASVRWGIASNPCAAIPSQ